VDRSLRLLMALRAQATLRLWGKSLRRPQGIVVAVVLGLLVVPWFVYMVAFARADGPPPLESIRRHGPLLLTILTLGMLLFSAGEQALYYTPSEVTFLFAGPFGKRQLLGYKLVTTGLMVLSASFFFTPSARRMAPSIGSAFVGSTLFFLFLQLLQIAIGLGANTLGALAWGRGRRVALAALSILAGLVLAAWGRDLASGGALAILDRVEASPIASVILAPFRPFVLAFTAESGRQLAWWGSASLLVDGALVALIFALDASYLEVASAASARRFAKIQRMIAGGGGVRGGGRRVGRLGFRPPEAPWWGGVGPNLWRQSTMALGNPGRLALVASLLCFYPLLLSYMNTRSPLHGNVILYVCEASVLGMSFAIGGLLPYDFRGDVDMMEELKALPIAPTRVALGQVLTPVLVTSVTQAVGLLSALIPASDAGLAHWSILPFLLPINLMFFAIENLLFLWYPSRMAAGQVDIMAVGRQMLFTFGKIIALVVGLGLASLVGALAYWATGGSLPSALVLGWLAAMASALALIPLVGVAFERFDVARDVPT